MRATVHLMTAPDALSVRPVVQSVLERGFLAHFGKAAAGLDLAAVAARAATLAAEQPRTRGQLGEALVLHWPEADPSTLGYATSYLVPLVQVPPRGLWGRTGPPALTTIESWLDSPVGTDATPDELVLRYLAAFGPASVRDVAVWSGLAGIREAVDRLRPRLRRRVPLPPGNGALVGTLLVDGTWSATWRTERAAAAATLVVEPFVRLRPRQEAEVTAEGLRLLAFTCPDAEAEVRLIPAP
jgi:hypothetical protein